MRLRFRKGQAKVLRNTAERLARGSDVERAFVPAFMIAAAATKAGRPCEIPAGASAEDIADGFVRFGCPRPEIVA